MLMIILRVTVTIFGVILILVGIPLTPSPIPFGLVFIALGMSLIVWASPAAVRWLRKHWRWFDRRMDWLTDHLPGPIAQFLRRSDYDHEADQEDDNATDVESQSEARRAAIGSLLRER